MKKDTSISSSYVVNDEAAVVLNAEHPVQPMKSHPAVAADMSQQSQLSSAAIHHSGANDDQSHHLASFQVVDEVANSSASSSSFGHQQQPQVVTTTTPPSTSQPMVITPSLLQALQQGNVNLTAAPATEQVEGASTTNAPTVLMLAPGASTTTGFNSSTGEPDVTQVLALHQQQASGNNSPSQPQPMTASLPPPQAGDLVVAIPPPMLRSSSQNSTPPQLTPSGSAHDLPGSASAGVSITSSPLKSVSTPPTVPSPSPINEGSAKRNSGSQQQSTSSSSAKTMTLTRRMEVSRRNIFVSGLPAEVNDATLRQTFLPFGDIQSCRVLVNTKTGKHKGVGFVHYMREEAASEAIRMVHGSRPFGTGRALSVKYADEAAEFAPEESNKLFIRHVPRHVTPKDLTNAFEQFGGTVVEVSIRPDASSQGRREKTVLFMAYVTFQTIEQATAALSRLHLATVFGDQVEPLEVKYAETLECRNQRRRRGDGTPPSTTAGGGGRGQAAGAPTTTATSSGSNVKQSQPQQQPPQQLMLPTALPRGANFLPQPSELLPQQQLPLGGLPGPAGGSGMPTVPSALPGFQMPMPLPPTAGAVHPPFPPVPGMAGMPPPPPAYPPSMPFAPGAVAPPPQYPAGAGGMPTAIPPHQMLPMSTQQSNFPLAGRPPAMMMSTGNSSAVPSAAGPQKQQQQPVAQQQQQPLVYVLPQQQ